MKRDKTGKENLERTKREAKTKKETIKRNRKIEYRRQGRRDGMREVSDKEREGDETDMTKKKINLNTTQKRNNKQRQKKRIETA